MPVEQTGRHSLSYGQRDRQDLFETVAHEQVADLQWSPPVQEAYERNSAKERQRAPGDE